MSPNRGWISPWYWFRLRHWTVSEIRHRSLELPIPHDFSEPAQLRSEFCGILQGGSKLLVRISRQDWLEDTIRFGRLRLAPASSYQLIENDWARTDDELVRHQKSPGAHVTITGPDGKSLSPIGDVTYSRTRWGFESQPDVDYGLISFSTDLDTRLLQEFSSETKQDAILVIFDPIGFVKRCLPQLNRIAPFSEKALEQVDYHDEYHPTQKDVPVRSSKEMRFALQREWRLVVDPCGQEVFPTGEAIFFDVGSLGDIAGLYSPDGSLICGSGPTSFLK